MPFAPRGSAAEIEEGRAFAPKFDAAGLIACVVAAADSGEVLMVAHMNAQALTKTLETGEAWFYSRSRKALWKKGETSGHLQRVLEVRIDCDADAVLLRVESVEDVACHTGRRRCFFSKLEGEGGARRWVATDPVVAAPESPNG
jgi:phosphoribosyl-AMP cyclohydrolase